MKNKSLNLRISERRLNKLRLYSIQKDMTMTRIIEDFIDSLKLENGDSSSLRDAPRTTPRPVKPVV
ncbi:hypothetical protein CDG79_12380 [Nostoc sp. 'Peltigera membranacea cyanobiont' 232]|nr:hypothetical protein [Nostoc sp. 'Peltigera membranacea cyanobiont' 232]OYE04569.1 hypothetical protein CDG79_12380 [Nostoc sp. 'Peltigera membranacea cyanobiont' 232]